MSTAMTIFCHGTKSYTDEVKLNPANGLEYGEAEQELVWVLEKHYQLPRERQGDTFGGGKLLLQGVGSLNDPTANRVTRTPDGLQGRDSSASKAMPGAIGAASRLINMACGNGIGQNISKAIAFLEYMVDQGKRPSSVNLVGWSRGGVTCVRLAQSLHDNAKLRSLPVNIFAGDPVPGLGRHASFLSTSKEYAITPNVKTYLQVMAMHVSSNLFKPLRPAVVDGGETSVCAVLALPGNHSQVVKAGMGMSGQITVDMAIRFLRACGSTGVDVEALGEHRLARDTVCDFYDSLARSIRRNDGTFPAPKALNHEIGFGGALAHALDFGHDRRRDAARANAHYMSGGEFINEHHQYLSERRNPGRGGAPIAPALRTLFDRMYAG